MLKIGLTGGIASGKSQTAGVFSDLGVTVIDTDQLAREVLGPGSPGLREVTETFGKHLLHEDGSLDRRALRRIVFSDPAARRTLEKITHPRIIALLHERLAGLSDQPYVIVEIPLLAESGLTGELDRVLVVDAPEDLQIERLMRRDSESADEAQMALKAQSSRSARLELADDIIVNDADREKLRQEVRALHERYLELAHRLSKRLPSQDCYNPDS